MAKNAGIRVISDSGILQIDSSYRNFHLIDKMEAPHYNDPATGNVAKGTLSKKSKSPTSIVAYGMDSWYPNVMPRTPSEVTAPLDYNGDISRADLMVQPWCTFPGRFAYDFYGYEGLDNFDVTTSGLKIVNIVRESSGPRFVYETVDYRSSMPPKSANVKCSIYEFDLVNLADSQTKSGMQIFNAEGKLVFDSEYKPMRVVKFFQSPVYWRENGATNNPPPNIWELPKFTDGIKRKYAIAPLDSIYRFYNNYTGGYYTSDDYVTSGGDFSVDTFQWQQDRILHYPAPVPALVRDYPEDYLYTGMTTVNYLLLDVTGY